MNGNMDDNEALNGGEHYPSPLRMTPMEMEAEMASLVDETGDFSSVVSKLTLRKKRRPSAFDSSSSTVFSSAGFRGLLRTKTAFMVRNAMVLGLLGWLVLLFVGKMDRTVENLEQHAQDEDPRGVHQNSFGGKKNTGQPAGAKAHQQHEDEFEGASDILIPETSNVGEHVPSISMENAVNLQGHYWHDPYQSPFASHLYALNDTVLFAAQQEFEEKLTSIGEEYGKWDLVDPYYDEHNDFRPKVDVDAFKDGDAPISSFPDDAWQMDEEYVGNFVEQAKQLIHRVKEGIYTEYGHPSKTPDGKMLSPEKLKERDDLFRVILDDFAVNNKSNKPQAIDMKTKKPLKGVAYMHRNAWDGLVQKLLHALITNDDFFVVLTGDGTAAGHGNNFIQSSIMSFHYLMEPVFHILGMRLISRNMAMRDASTTFSALGGGDIYGEADVLWYSAEEPESDGQLDLLYKQSILSGERVPVLLTPKPGNIVHDSKGQAWVGNLQPASYNICEATTKTSINSLPPACQFADCVGVKAATSFCRQYSYDSVCWVDRKNDAVPPTDQDEAIKPSTGYPGYRAHQLEGRKLSLLILHALDEALDVWTSGIEKDGFPLLEDYWHIGDLHEGIRESVRTNLSPDPDERPPCEALFSAFPMVCHVEMHAFTDWTPRITPRRTSLKNLLHPDMNSTTLYPYVDEVYEGIDILRQSWSIPLDQVDVHAIAISTAAPPPNNDYDDGSDFFFDDDNDMSWVFQDDQELYDDDISMDDDTFGRSLRSVDDAAQVTKSRERSSLGQLAVTLPPGQGWSVFNPVAGFCDGSSQAMCNRKPDNTCLMAGHNDHKSGLLGDGLSGWLKLVVEGVREGIILARLDDTSPGPRANERTDGWTSVDQGGRALNLPSDFEFDYAINGKITTLSKAQFRNFGVQVAEGMVVYPLLLDESMSEKVRDESDVGETFEVSIRIRSSSGRDATILLSHIYYA